MNDAIRVALKIEKLVGDVETDVTTFQPVDLTTAQKRDARSYTPETVLVFNRDVRGFKAGELARLKQITDTHLIVESDTRIALISFDHLEKLTVCQSREMALAAGDRLQLKANGRSVENRKLVNGELVTVKMIRPDGRIALKDGRVLAENFGSRLPRTPSRPTRRRASRWTMCCFQTRWRRPRRASSNGMSPFRAAKRGIHIFTTDKEQLRENITRSADRPSVMDLLAAHYQNDWFYRQIEQRWGQRAAVIMTQNRRAQESRRSAGNGCRPNV